MPGDIPLHGRLIALLKADRPVGAHLVAVAVYLTLPCVEIHLIDAQIVPAVQNLEAIINEGLRVALLEETPDQSLDVLLECPAAPSCHTGGGLSPGCFPNPQ